MGPISVVFVFKSYGYGFWFQNRLKTPKNIKKSYFLIFSKQIVFFDLFPPNRIFFFFFFSKTCDLVWPVFWAGGFSVDGHASCFFVCLAAELFQTKYRITERSSNLDVLERSVTIHVENLNNNTIVFSITVALNLVCWFVNSAASTLFSREGEPLWSIARGRGSGTLASQELMYAPLVRCVFRPLHSLLESVVFLYFI